LLSGLIYFGRAPSLILLHDEARDRAEHRRSNDANNTSDRAGLSVSVVSHFMNTRLLRYARLCFSLLEIYHSFYWSIYGGSAECKNNSKDAGFKI